MSTTVKTGWLNDKNGDKFAPKTLTSQVQTSDGILIEDKIQTDLDTVKQEILDEIGDINLSTYETKTDAQTKLDEAKSYTDTAISGFATETYVNTKIVEMVDSAPETLNTLNELAAALGDDPNFATTIATQIGQKTDRLTAYMFDSVDGRCDITIDGYTEYTNGDMIQVIIINTVQGDTLSLNINNLGDVQIYRPCSDGGYTNQFYGANKLVNGHMYTFVYFTGAFYCLQLTKPYGEDDFVKPVAITSGGTGAKNAVDALKNLGITATATELNKMDGVTATTTELNYVAGAKSNIQTQLNNKAPSEHNHEVADITGTMSVSKGGTGTTTFTSGTAIIGNGTDAFTTRSITNNTGTSDSISGSTNLITLNTLRYAINRTTSVAAADTNYSTYMARGMSLNSSEKTPTANGTIAWTYE